MSGAETSAFLMQRFKGRWLWINASLTTDRHLYADTYIERKKKGQLPFDSGKT